VYPHNNLRSQELIIIIQLHSLCIINNNNNVCVGELNARKILIGKFKERRQCGRRGLEDKKYIKIGHSGLGFENENSIFLPLENQRPE
jgi:hypothetical protein